MAKITHVFSVSLIPSNIEAALKLRAEIDALRVRDDSLGMETDLANEIILKGVSELQLDHAVDKLRRSAGFAFEVGQPQIIYIETITKTIEWSYTHMERLGRFQAIPALVSLANLFGYDRALKSMTRGRATYIMEFDHYEQLPPMRPDDGEDTFPPAVGKRA